MTMDFGTVALSAIKTKKRIKEFPEQEEDNKSSFSQYSQ